MRIIHAADLHIDSQLAGLSAALVDHAESDLIAGATRSAFRALIDWALHEQPDAVVLAGDIFDGSWKHMSTRRVFVDGMRDLADAGIPVVMASGNHDAASVLMADVRYPDTMRVLSVDAPDSYRLDDLGLSFHGQGYATPAIEHSLAAHYPVPDPGQVNIGLLHANVGGSAGHDNYSPCTADDLRRLGYDYVALGHVHTRREFADGGRIFAAYPGNLQGRSVRETGPKGALLIDFADPLSPGVAFQPLDVLRWEVIDIYASDPARTLTSTSDVLDAVSAEHQRLRALHGDMPLIVRTRITADSRLLGTLRLSDDLTDQMRDVVSGSLLEKVSLQRAPESESSGPIVDAVLRAQIEQAIDELEPGDISAVLSDVRTRTQALLRDTGVDLSSTQALSALIREAGQELLDEIAAGGPS